MLSRCSITAFSQIPAPPPPPPPPTTPLQNQLLLKKEKRKSNKKMSSNTTEASYFLIPATSGLCIQPQDGNIQTSHLNGEPSQQWFIEHQTNSDKKIAFKNASSGEYLRATKGRVTVGEKHFWSIHLSTNTPNAFRIQFDSRQFLCNM